MSMWVEAGASGDRLAERVPRREGGQSEGAAVDSKVEVEADGGESGMVVEDGGGGCAEGAGDDFTGKSLDFAQFVGNAD